MTLSIFPSNNFNLPPITQDHNQRADDAGDNGRTTRATPRASSTTRDPSRYTNKQLIKEVKKHFEEYAAGAGDKYVNFNELKEAAGQRPSTRTFSQQASAVATELLKRERLLNQLDIGVGAEAQGRGLKDQRFDHDNLNYMIRVSSDKPRVRFNES